MRPAPSVHDATDFLLLNTKHLGDSFLKVFARSMQRSNLVDLRRNKFVLLTALSASAAMTTEKHFVVDVILVCARINVGWILTPRMVAGMQRVNVISSTQRDGHSWKFFYRCDRTTGWRNLSN